MHVNYSTIQEYQHVDMYKVLQELEGSRTNAAWISWRALQSTEIFGLGLERFSRCRTRQEPMNLFCGEVAEIEAG